MEGGESRQGTVHAGILYYSDSQYWKKKWKKKGGGKSDCEQGPWFPKIIGSKPSTLRKREKPSVLPRNLFAAERGGGLVKVMPLPICIRLHRLVNGEEEGEKGF